MSQRLIVQPSIEPVTLDDAKLNSRIDSSDEDAFIVRAIRSARRQVEHRLNRALITQTWELTLDAFPASEIKIVEPSNVLSIVSVKYLDETGAEQTVPSTDYALDLGDPARFVLLAEGATWPTTSGGANCVKVRYTAGYGPAASDVPDELIDYILAIVDTRYRFRGAIAAGVSVSELPTRFLDGMLDRERVY